MAENMGEAWYSSSTANVARKIIAESVRLIPTNFSWATAGVLQEISNALLQAFFSFLGAEISL